ncbi:hypothetical protein Micbo1qcDRAFT_205797 [Microdochium bolleyi]|uniref:Uncharacterized protein n=1 Tax=Microdochium bolleyi TaxID=196109 RepID=A0A136IYW0_9PEZI|nr:hypothetical protein Micbo1qcDRAFT_205797 [Microdochium bolleyi]
MSASNGIPTNLTVILMPSTGSSSGSSSGSSYARQRISVMSKQLEEQRKLVWEQTAQLRARCDEQLVALQLRNERIQAACAIDQEPAPAAWEEKP